MAAMRQIETGRVCLVKSADGSRVMLMTGGEPRMMEAAGLWGRGPCG